MRNDKRRHIFDVYCCVLQAEFFVVGKQNEKNDVLHINKIKWNNTQSECDGERENR